MSLTILETRKIAKSRKPWHCDGCHREFPAGTPKDCQRIIGDHGPYSIQWCVTCQGIAGMLFDLDRGFWDDGVTDDHILEAMQDEFGTWEAADARFGNERGEA